MTSSVFALGSLIFLIGIFQFASGLPKVVSELTPSSLTERNIAIKAAKESGRTDYSYTTHFIPGIGIIANPQDYLNQMNTKVSEGETQSSETK
ncbi:MAG: hypothetical protein NUV80_00165 [Candidatus Berkelbacteria bacterium]|nr:hypothetical protein [Candidatus Berkelbacteria bacterium]MCR4306966.1 hypothetical protein [Candidatus Berkelbacteria bacterium]